MTDPVVLAGATSSLGSLGDERLLTETERGRAARMRRPADRADYIAAHLLARHCAAELLGRPPGTLTLAQRCGDCDATGHGRPYFAEAPEVGVSLTHTRGYVCAAAGPGKVGVDAERVPDGPFDDAVAGQSLAPGEVAVVTGNRALIRQWVRKESLVKRGELTLAGLRSLDLSALPLDEPGVARALRWQGRHLLEWAEGDVLVTAITDSPARRSFVFTP
ncbi:phosphopantetheinyl transferase-like protein [Spongiactinospora sp. TRM90649]|uniref:4'-phosphopantetheinyl transferase family protein n=1 Tax=Spongiactinospora sp. TRM90649 TaxID=3031114 RepID=UPI0023F68C06|nr:phosphopantetheinyl transferase-like protein [Spongiactinospora sp. TRM90649]MDF5755911.1 phosphopantetheinyl transferase-like protein [Spongiactinospora sp. TRM90649]